MKNKNNLTTGLAVIQTLLLLFIAFQVYQFGKPGMAPQAPSAPQPQAAAPAPPPIQDVALGNNPIRGKANAPVTIVEFSDYQCPFCAKFFTDSFGQIDKQYIQTGKVKFAFRNYPLPFHQYAQRAAEATECAKDQGKYWEYSDMIFQNQASLNLDILKKWATDLKLDSKKFNDCLDSGKKTAEVQQDAQEGAKYGVQGTPSFFVNGKMLVGAQPFSAFQQEIDTQLNK